jgi:hypothetical protein
VTKIPAGNLIKFVAMYMPEMLLYRNISGEQVATSDVGKSGWMKLFPLTGGEAKFLADLLENTTTQTPVTSAITKRHNPRTNIDPMRIASVMKSGGLDVYVGSVTDQDGDSSWELTSNLSRIRKWADELAVVSFEIPKSYKVLVTRGGFGPAKQIAMKYDKSR